MAFKDLIFVIKNYKTLTNHGKSTPYFYILLNK